MKTMHRLALAALLLLATFPSFAQAAAGAPRRVLLVVSQAPGAAFDADALLMMSRSLITALQMDPGVAGTRTLLVDPVAPGLPASDDALDAAAAAQGADAWLLVEPGRNGDAVTLRLRSMDLGLQQVVIDTTVNVQGTLSPLELAGMDWSAVAHLVARAYPATGNVAAAASVPRRGSARLLIHGHPGSTVAIRGLPDLHIGSDGTATVSLDAPAQYVLRATAPGYTPVTRSLYLAANREISFDQKRTPSWALSVRMVDFAYPGADLSLLVASGPVFVTAGFTTYMVGLALNQEEILSSTPLTNLALQVGAYLAPADSIVRPYFGFGVFARVVDAPAYVGLDPLSPGGLQLVLGVETAGRAEDRFFVEYVPQFFATRFPALLEASLGAGNTPPGWLFSVGSAADLLSFRIGYRWKW